MGQIWAGGGEKYLERLESGLNQELGKLGTTWRGPGWGKRMIQGTAGLGCL